jgi:nickel/cobalt transporter (NicO) family protein
MRRVLLIAVLALAAWPAAASAHPLGNFSINHLTEVSVSTQRVDIRYVLDQAEIPTFQERGLSDAEVIARKQAEVQRRLALTVDGRRIQLRTAGAATISHPPGAGGLRTTRLELPLTAAVPAPAHPADFVGGHTRVAVRDDTFPGRVGWHAVLARPGHGTAVRSDVPSSDPTDELRHYPQDALSSPADIRAATLSVQPGAGTVSAPDGRRSGGSSDQGRVDVLSRAFSDAAAGRGVLVLLLLTAFAWGAIHALSPGHGKAMVAAYLVGSRGSARHAAALGATVTITHTAGVFALGLVALGLSQYVLPEDLYPWLNLVSGVLVVGVGAYVLRKNLVRRRHRHHHHHDHAPPEKLSWRGIVAMGAAAGLIPCPSALVVLLGAIAQGQIALGMLMIVAFSLGLACTLTGLGMAVVYAGRAFGRLNVPSRLVTALPSVSALLIVGVGLVLTVNAVPQV